MNTNLFYKKTLFLKSIKKRTFKDFGCGIGVRFFFSESLKNAPQFAPQNPSKNHIFPRDLEKNAPQFAPQNPSKNHIFPHDFEKKRTSICNPKLLKLMA